MASEEKLQTADYLYHCPGSMAPTLGNNALTHSLLKPSIELPKTSTQLAGENPAAKYTILLEITTN
jgi:hypothetical protein